MTAFACERRDKNYSRCAIIFRDSSTVKKIAIDIWFFPTLISTAAAAAAATATARGASLSPPSSSSPSVQNIWSWGEGFRLDLLSSGYLLVTYDINTNNIDQKQEQEQEQTTKIVCTASKVLKQRRWYHIRCALIVGDDDDDDDDNRCIVKCHLSVKNKDDEDTLFTSNAVVATAKASYTLDIDAPFTIAMGGRLNGRIEDPVIRITEKDADKKEFILASWDTSFYSSKEDPWTIPCNDGAIIMEFIENKNKNVASLILFNHPTRGVKGRRWDGTEFCWKHCPKHYGAIHFHDDDVYDFKWISNMEWRVPTGIPSGIYIMRFVTTNDDDDDDDCPAQQHEEALPLFICAPKKKKGDDDFDSSSSDIQQPPVKLMKTNGESKPSTTTCSEIKKNKLVVLIPTFTYVMYGNHNRPDFEIDPWLARNRNSPGSYPYNPALFPAYGHSSYDFHSDQTGINFASHLRPLFNLRPGYITFSRFGGPGGGSKDDNDDNSNNNNNTTTQENSNSTVSSTSFCSGLRHFPADSHIICWLHHFGFEFDVITDHELHREGPAALSQYSTLLTSTHPEYHTLQSLDTLQKFRDVQGGNLVYLGGNGFYWKIGASSSITPTPTSSSSSSSSNIPQEEEFNNNNNNDDCKLLEIRRCEGGVRTYATEPGEYYNFLDGGMYGGLLRNSDRSPSKLVGISFAAQGSFIGKPYQRTCYDRPDITDWVFKGISDKETKVLGNFGFSGDGAAGYELDAIVPTDEFFRDGNIVILAQAHVKADKRYALVPEEVLTPWTNLAGTTNEEAKRADMIYFRVPKSGAQIFSVGSITFCGCLPYNNFENNISHLMKNVVDHFLEAGNESKQS